MRFPRVVEFPVVVLGTYSLTGVSPVLEIISDIIFHTGRVAGVGYAGVGEGYDDSVAMAYVGVDFNNHSGSAAVGAMILHVSTVKPWVECRSETHWWYPLEVRRLVRDGRSPNLGLSPKS